MAIAIISYFCAKKGNNGVVRVVTSALSLKNEHNYDVDNNSISTKSETSAIVMSQVNVSFSYAMRTFLRN